jgi:carboxymethylenebutenolidase
MGETIRLTAEDGHLLDAYRADAAGSPRGGLVIVQEIFGVNGHIKRVADGYAADGYVCVAPALFDRVERGFAIGYAQDDIERGRGVRGKIDVGDMVKDVRAAVAFLRSAGQPRVAVVGYCMGGTLAWLAATRIDGVAAAIGYYGGGVADAAGEEPRCPVLLHFGETDQSIPPSHWNRIRAAHPALPLHIYPAGHGFNCDERAAYHEPSAALARRRTLEFLARHMNAQG